MSNNSNLKNKLKILFVTGTRADYGKLEPLARAALNHQHHVTFFVTGMHLMAKYGLTKTEVHRESRFRVVEFINQREGDPQDIIFSKTAVGFSDYIKEQRPDLVIVHGDRVEAFACSFVCATNYVCCAHVEGGEVSGTIDEIFRHCNTKLSDYHLVSSEEARSRVLRLGEAAENTFVIGSPELDMHSRPSGITLSDVMTRYEITNQYYGICVFHPVTSELDNIRKQAASFFETLRQTGNFFVVIMPNNDPGSESIVEIIESLPADQFRVLPSMRFSYFSELLRNSQAVVGNSSVGVREAPFLGIPSLNVGTRQSNRGTATSIWNCEAFDVDTIKAFFRHSWGTRYPPDVCFGTGDATSNFIDFLSQIENSEHKLQKYFSD